MGLYRCIKIEGQSEDRCFVMNFEYFFNVYSECTHISKKRKQIKIILLQCYSTGAEKKEVALWKQSQARRSAFCAFGAFCAVPFSLFKQLCDSTLASKDKF